MNGAWIGTALITASACGPPRAEVGHHWVFVSGAGDMIEADSPKTASLLDPDGGAACLSEEDMRLHFGNTCPRHEAEGEGTPSMTGSFGHGLNPTPAQVRWYCSCPMVARVVLERCPGDTFRVRELALATDKACR